jgi:hypothetical protein
MHSLYYVLSVVSTSGATDQGANMMTAIVRAGDGGGSVARAAVAAGHAVTLSATAPQPASQAAQAAAGADIVLLAGACRAFRAIALGYRVIDACGLRIDRSLQEMAPLNSVLNVRNNLPWQSAGEPLGPTGEPS